MGNTTIKNKNKLSDYKSLKLYNENEYAKQKLIENQHQQLQNSKTFKNQEYLFEDNDAFLDSDCSLNDFIFDISKF